MVWTRDAITNEALDDIVSALHGYWKDEGGREAVIEDGSARVFVSASSDLGDAYDDDVRAATEELQETPKGIVWINVGHGNGSDMLAGRIAEMILNRRPGVLNRNEMPTKT
jgi:hypothetical protein